jgi:hypothetical protein
MLSYMILGLLTESMNKLGVKFGYLTTYRQTVFIRMEQHQGVTVLLYSPITKHSDHAKENEECKTMDSVSLRLGVFFMMCQASLGHARI